MCNEGQRDGSYEIPPGCPEQSVGTVGKPSAASRPETLLPPEPSRNRSYPTPQAGGRRLHLAGPSPACAVLVTSTLADDWRSHRMQVVCSPGRKARRPEPIPYRIDPEPSHIRISLATIPSLLIPGRTSSPAAGRKRSGCSCNYGAHPGRQRRFVRLIDCLTDYSSLFIAAFLRSSCSWSIPNASSRFFPCGSGNWSKKENHRCTMPSKDT